MQCRLDAMKRFHRILVTFSAAAIAWGAVLWQVAHGAAAAVPVVRLAALWAPVAVVILLGGYMFLQLLWGVATFRSCPGEADALKKDILRARRDLAARGFRPANGTTQ